MNDDRISSAVILNVDDFEPGRYARTRVLEQAGYRVLEANTGRNALSLIQEHRPDLILLDINLPDMSGMDLCRRIKADSGFASTLVVHVSATAITNADWAQALDTGADAYLSDPVDPPVLIATVRALLRLASSERALARSNRELLRSNEDLARFAYAASHDLQEPLRTITAYSQLLQKRFASELGLDGGQFVHFIYDAAIRMSNLIRDLLVYSQAGAARQIKDTDLNVVLERTLHNLRISIDESSAKITNDPLPVVEADEEQIAIVLQNLIGNAIKYRSERPLTVHVGSCRRGRNWVISVADNGLGFDQKYAGTVFEPFRRLDRERSGTGIGLALAKRVIEDHGGEIWVESEAGRGSTFFFALPALEGALASI